jgi:tetratricopeptide (TPR) repeat protein
MYHLVEAKKIIDPIIELTLNSGSMRRIYQIYIILGVYNYVIEEDFPIAFKHLKRALKISQDEKDMASLFFANFWLGAALAYYGEFDESTNYTQKALEINIAANTAWGIAAVKAVMSINYAFPTPL